MTDIHVPDHPSTVLPEFSDEQITALVDCMTAAGKARAHAQGADFSEFDYLSGCMATLVAVGRQDRIPVAWIFDAFADRSPLDLPSPSQEVVERPGVKRRGKQSSAPSPSSACRWPRCSSVSLISSSISPSPAPRARA
jgi:hypothetical protein